jgi:hypothetical protein
MTINPEVNPSPERCAHVFEDGLTCGMEFWFALHTRPAFGETVDLGPYGRRIGHAFVSEAQLRADNVDPLDTSGVLAWQAFHAGRTCPNEPLSQKNDPSTEEQVPTRAEQLTRAWIENECGDEEGCELPRLLAALFAIKGADSGHRKYADQILAPSTSEKVGLTFQAEVELEAVREHGCKHRTGGDVCAECFEALYTLSRRSTVTPEEREVLTTCDGWTIAFNAYSAGTGWGAKHPNATGGEVMGACERYASAIFPHEVCDSGEPFTQTTHPAPNQQTDEAIRRQAEKIYDRLLRMDGNDPRGAVLNPKAINCAKCCVIPAIADVLRG